jgi:GxxExxY protein
MQIHLIRVIGVQKNHYSMKHEQITEKIIQAFYKVYNTLGYGFLEKVYENAMYIELTEMGFKVDRQKRVLVYYKSHIVGDYSSDLTIEDVVICELKTNEMLATDNENQLINYLKATTIEVGLLLNFGKKPEIRRKIYDNDKKEWYTTRVIPIQS